MTSLGHEAVAAPPAPDLAVVSTLLRAVVFVGAFSLAWISLRPFQSLGRASAADFQSGNEVLTYVLYAALAALALGLALPRLRYAFGALATGPVVVMVGWLAATSVISDDPSTSVKRLAFALIIMMLGALLFLLPRDQRELARLLAASAGLLLFLSYAGLVLAPELTIHQASDVLEPQLAGDWRGVFGHKNGAAAAFSFCTFIGLFVVRSGMPVVGTLVGVGAALFVFQSGGKSASMLLVASFMIGLFWEKTAGRFLRVAVALAPLLLLLAFGVGSALFPALGAITAKLPVDATFTGRTDIWQFAADSLPGHYLTGHGFQAFWNTPERLYGSSEVGWAGTAAHAHNSYLDLVVENGLPGLLFGIAFLIVMPIRDVFAAQSREASAALLTMMVQIWLFGIYIASLETFFFSRPGPMWLIFVFAIFGLRYAARYKLKRVE